MKYKSYILLLIIAIGMVGCRPKGILSSAKMRDVMYDLHRMDGMIDQMKMKTGYDEQVGRYYQGVMDKHHVTQAQFDSSLVWYTNHPALFDKIYPKVMDRLDADIAQLEREQQREQERDDLLRGEYAQVMPYRLKLVMWYMLDLSPERQEPLNHPLDDEWMIEIKAKMQKKIK